MLRDMLSLLQEKGDFFLKLLIEHMQISLIAIIIATVIGLILGVIISEYKKSSKTILGIINFMYTIPSISLLGFLIPFHSLLFLLLINIREVLFPLKPYSYFQNIY